MLIHKCFLLHITTCHLQRVYDTATFYFVCNLHGLTFRQLVTACILLMNKVQNNLLATCDLVTTFSATVRSLVSKDCNVFPVV